MSTEIKVINGVVHIPYQSILDYAYMILENSNGYPSFENMEWQHQQEVNRVYGRFSEKEYEEVPFEEIQKYNEYVKELRDEWENDDWGDE